MVFQDYALFPHLTVEGNISFPLNRWRGKERQARLADLLALVGLQGVAKRFPHQLSGGQQQRVALARALAVQPPIVLLDEPFSNLDAALRKSTRAEVRHILKASHTSAVFVTHDQEEALSIADRIGVMYGGVLLQVGTPQEVYLRPVDRTVATFIGEANFIPAEGAGEVADCILGRLPLVQPAHGPLDLLLRPECLRLRPAPDGPARIETLQFLGSDQALGLRLPDDNLIHARARAHETLRLGERVALETVGACVAFPRADRASPAPEGR
jgi:iron(III) transport system ATP-binding protein